MTDTKQNLSKKMDSMFEKYRICRYLSEVVENEENEEIKKYRDFCQQIEKAVNHLPDPEKMLIKESYMKQDYDYITDFDVYNTLEISAPTFIARREKALLKLDFYFTTTKLCS